MCSCVSFLDSWLMKSSAKDVSGMTHRLSESTIVKSLAKQTIQRIAQRLKRVTMTD